VITVGFEQVQTRFRRFVQTGLERFPNLVRGLRGEVWAVKRFSDCLSKGKDARLKNDTAQANLKSSNHIISHVKGEISNYNTVVVVVGVGAQGQKWLSAT
jgi:hypothetical protein